ncbi:Double-stranded RNA-binding domain [Cinara cedri]|uniref:Double-stranded RNA-binding domain n=1 Tax=Cinara cedri TaxID=506608 RepID=A0A5E4MEE3_9HEMI|nr:Double-stranded RNA-binding domain [Cinara cedri]
MSADMIVINEDKANNSRKKLKVAHINLESLCGEEKPISKNFQLSKEESSHKNSELLKKKLVKKEKSCDSIDRSCMNDDDIYKTDKSLDFNKEHSNKDQFVDAELTILDNDPNVDKNGDNESDNYVQFSDCDFELENNTNEINDYSNYISNANKNIFEDSPKANTDVNEIGSSQNNINDSIIINDEEIDNLLDKAYLEKKNPKKTVSNDDFKVYAKSVLEEIGTNHFDILPENWIVTTHRCGMPIYLHKSSRVVTLARPYFLGPGDPASHLAPLSAITCLQYKKGLETKERLKNEPDFQIRKQGNMIIPNAKVETVQENIIKESLTHEELQKYCQSLFKFKKVKAPLKKEAQPQPTSSESDPTQKNTKERPSLPDSTKLISFPVQSEDQDKQCSRRDWLINPNGKSYVCILHQYLQHVFKTQPSYVFKKAENSETYSATVILNGVKYGVGFGNSKKQAKQDGARITLNILIPDIKNQIDSDEINKSEPVIFDQIKITNPRVSELCVKTGELSPYSILLVCLQRNFGECEVKIDYLSNHRKILNQCKMVVDKHTASVPCKSKKEGKQKASQVILSLLHPHIDNWGSLVRLYGNRSIQNTKKKKQEQQEITQLQCKTDDYQPNVAILNKLKNEMITVDRQHKLNNSNAYSMLTKCPYTINISSTPSTSNSN